MKPRVNNPAWVQAIQDVMDLMAAGAYPADQVNADPNGTAFPQFLGGTGSMLTWWGDVGSNVRTNDTSVVGEVTGFSINPGADEVYNSKTGAVGEAGRRTELRAEHGLYRLGRLRHQPRLRRREEAQGGVVRGGPSRRQGSVAVDGGLSVRLPALPQLALQRTRSGKRRAMTGPSSRTISAPTSTATITRTPRSSRASPASSSTTRSLEDELVKGINGQYGSAQETADAIAAAWEKITDQIGRDNQIKLYKASLGM